MAACADPNLGYVTLFIDGLDECEESGRTVILSWLAKHVSTLTTSASSNASFLKVLMTSWPETCIADTMRIRDLPEVRLKLEDQSENVSADVERVVRAKLDDLAEFRRLSDDERDRLERQLLGNAEQTFLWVSLFLDMLQTSALATSRSWSSCSGRRPMSTLLLDLMVLRRCSWLSTTVIPRSRKCSMRTPTQLPPPAWHDTGYWFMMAGPSVVQAKVVFVIQSFNFCITFIHCIAGVFL
jgi:hypothetical protein